MLSIGARFRVVHLRLEYFWYLFWSPEAIYSAMHLDAIDPWLILVTLFSKFHL